jgi:uncharacterized repeat protein (TIGR01451 family)
MSFTSALPTPSNVNGNQVTWTFPAFGVYASADLNVQLQVPADINLLGQPYAHVWSVDQPIAESSLANNAWSITGIITAAYDPNDKTARTSSGSSNALYYIGQDEWVDYTIRFQNTGTDTAVNIVVTDTIASELDLSTFEQGVASHAFTVEFKDDRVVASHGVVNFRIKPVQPLLPGTEIRNTADIYFDFNPPVITEASVLIAEFSTGTQAEGPGEVGRQLTLFPNPAQGSVMISAPSLMRSVQVFAADGREVVCRSVRSSNSTIDVTGLRAGSYYLFATLNNGSVVREQFIKL